MTPSRPDATVIIPVEKNTEPPKMVEYKLHQYVLRSMTNVPLGPSEREQYLKKEIIGLKHKLAEANLQIDKLRKQRAKKRRQIEYDLLKKIKVLDRIFDKIDLDKEGDKLCGD